MQKKQITIAVGINDRTLPLLAGLVEIEDVDATYITAPLEAIFARAFDDQAYDVTELSFSNYLYLTAIGESPYIGLPIFPSRSFRHSAIYIRGDRGISSPRDLIGRTVGVREYSMTAALVARGILEDDYGVTAQEVKWRIGPADSKDSQPIARVLPKGVALSAIGANENLSDMLRDGELDAMIAYKPPPAFTENEPHVQRLFENPATIEIDYARRTGLFPIMHLIGVRRDLARERPDLLVKLCAGFNQAQRYSFDRLNQMQALYSMLPWGAEATDRTREILGDDFWAYGLKRNQRALESLCRYSFVQGIAPRQLSPAELFASETLDWTGEQIQTLADMTP